MSEEFDICRGKGKQDYSDPESYRFYFIKKKKKTKNQLLGYKILSLEF